MKIHHSYLNNARKVFARLSVVAVASVIGAACNGGGGGVYYAPAWYDVYGNYCGGSPGPGCNFYADGSQIVDVEDPFFYSSYNLSFNSWFYTDSYGNPMIYTGDAWVSPSGIIYDAYGYALNSNNDGSDKDLIAQVEETEKRVYEAVGKEFAEKYALNEAKGIQIAHTLSDYATLVREQKRARTAEENEKFTQQLMGVTTEKAKNAVEEARRGNLGALEALNSEVADNWGTSAETTKTILKSWYKNQLKYVGM